MTNFSERFKEALWRAHLTQQDVADRTGIPKASISQYATGYVTPKNERLMKIASVLKVDPAYLLGLTDQPHVFIGTPDGLVSEDQITPLSADKLAAGYNMLTTANKEQLKVILFALLDSQMKEIGMQATEGITKEASDYISKERERAIREQELIDSIEWQDEEQ